MRVDQVEVTSHARGHWLHNIDRISPCKWTERREFLEDVIESADPDSKQVEFDDGYIVITHKGTVYVFNRHLNTFECYEQHHYNLVTFYQNGNHPFYPNPEELDTKYI